MNINRTVMSAKVKRVYKKGPILEFKGSVRHVQKSILLW